MDISLVTFADLGRRENLKTADVAPLIAELELRGELRQVVCRINAGHPFSTIHGAIPRTLHYLLALAGLMGGRWFDARLIEESVFDMRAQRILQSCDVAVFHCEYMAPRTLRRAKELGARTVGIATTAHPAYNARLEEEEADRLGVAGAQHLHYHKRAARLDASAQPEYLIVHSDFVKNTYVEQGFAPERILVATPDIDTRRFSPLSQPAEHPFTVLYMGQSTILKGLEYLLAAWERCDVPGGRLVLSGGYSDMPTILARRYNERIASDASIVWYSFTRSPRDLYRAASVVVLPSLTEGFGRVTLEAMACGAVVITTSAAGGIIEEGVNGFIVPPRDSEALAEKISYLANNEQARKRMGAAAVEAVLNKDPFGPRVADFLETVGRTK